MSDKYLETLEQLYLTSCELLRTQKQDEEIVAVLSALNSVLTNFLTSVDTLQGQRKENALNTIKTLQKVQRRFSEAVIWKLYWQKKCSKLEADVLDLAKRLDEATTRLNQLKEMEKF